MNRFTYNRRMHKALLTWTQNIGKLFVKLPDKHPSWDFVGGLKPANPSSDLFGTMLYLGNAQFYCYGCQAKITIYNNFLEWDKIFVPYEENAENKTNR